MQWVKSQFCTMEEVWRWMVVAAALQSERIYATEPCTEMLQAINFMCILPKQIGDWVRRRKMTKRENSGRLENFHLRGS